MSLVIDIRAYADPSIVPILVLVDLQQEYTTSSRAMAIASAGDAVVNCRAVLEHARKIGWPIAFVRWAGRAPFFNRVTKFSHWIEGFEPTRADMIFERDRPSCYACPQFSEVVASSGGNFVLAGFAGEAACLSTAIDAFHRGHRVTYVSDASASHALDGFSERDVHPIVSKVIGVYGDVVETEAWMAATSRRSRSHERPYLVGRGPV